MSLLVEHHAVPDYCFYNTQYYRLYVCTFVDQGPALCSAENGNIPAMSLLLNTGAHANITNSSDRGAAMVFYEAVERNSG